jgi:arylsulfatase A-like enzyme/Tfp pilus assembly protein PilF
MTERRRRTRRFTRALGLGSVALAISATACDRTPTTSGEALLLLTIDTLRADRLGCAGDPRARTPFLDRSARHGTQFAVAVAVAPLTLPSHATILSGALPPTHGARDNGSYRVHEDTPLLAETFASAGWETAAFVAAFPLASRFGLARGFETYGEATGVRRTGSTSSFAERSAGAVNADVSSFLASRESDRPLFLWVHYFDPHAPYAPPRHWARYATRDAYRGEIAYADREFGALERMLSSRFATVRVAITSDHGESLGEHGEESHGIFVYESTTRVPLSFAGEGMPRALRTEPVSLVEIATRLASWVGLTFDPGDHASLISPRADDEIYVESAYPLLRHGWSALRGLRTQHWKVIRAPEPEVYDLLADPGETRNLADDADARKRVAPLFSELASSAWDVVPPQESPDPQVEAALASLGYASMPERSEPLTDRPDPKEHVRIERYLGRATAALEAGQLADARAALALALGEDADNKEARLVRARLVAASGDIDGAFRMYEEALTLAPATLDALVYYETGRLALDVSDWARAEAAFERSVALDPLNADAVYNWGLAAYRSDRYADAEQRWRAALEIDPDHEFAREWIDDAARRAGEQE